VALQILSVEGYSPIEIHRGVKSLHVEDATDVSWVLRFKRTSVTGPRSGRPAAITKTEPKEERVDALLRGEGSIRTSELLQRGVQNWWLWPPAENLTT